MKQAFALPFLKTVGKTKLDDSISDTAAETRLWQQTLDRLSEKKLDFDLVLKKISVSSHPALRLATSRKEETLLHLAVLFNRLDAVKALTLLNSQLKHRVNAFGLTPYELSLFLSRREISQWLYPSASLSFSCQPHVSFLCRNNPKNSHLEPMPVAGGGASSWNSKQIETDERKNLFQEIEFLPQPLFENEHILEEILTQSRKAKIEDTIPAERIWMGIYFDEEIRKGSHPKVSIQYIDDQINFGVFAEKRIPPCAFVGEYTGVIQERKKRELKNQIYSVRYTVWETGRQFIINAEKHGNFTRFINHSAKPNLGLQSVYWRGMPRMVFIALKEISKGSQLTFDYGTIFWKEQKQTPILFE